MTNSACSDEGPSQPCPFDDLEDEDEEDMSESNWHMQQAIEASMNGGSVNPSIEEEMFGKPHSQIQSRVSTLLTDRQVIQLSADDDDDEMMSGIFAAFFDNSCEVYQIL